VAHKDNMVDHPQLRWTGKGFKGILRETLWPE